MQAKRDDDNGITNNIQEICLTMLHRYITHNQINTNIDVKMTQWWKNPCAEEI